MSASRPEGLSRNDVLSRSRALLGRWGEEYVRAHLLRCGYEVEATRWSRAPLGELDLVVAKGPLLCFVEVRTRLRPALEAKNWVEPAESVSVRKQRCIARTAEAYLLERRGARRDYLRFDIAAIWARGRHEDASYQNASFNYIENAFQVPWAF